MQGTGHWATEWLFLNAKAKVKVEVHRRAGGYLKEIVWPVHYSCLVVGVLAATVWDGSFLLAPAIGLGEKYRCYFSVLIIVNNMFNTRASRQISQPIMYI